mgnify:CR=1 FL=1
MPGLYVSQSLRCRVAATAEVGNATVYIMRVAREYVDQSLIKHPFCPISRILSESASYRSCRELHPDSMSGEALHDRIMIIDPAQSFRVRQNRHVARNEDVEEELLDALGHCVVGWLDQHVAAGAQSRDMARAQPMDEGRRHVGIGAWKDRQINTLVSQFGVECADGRADLAAGVVIHAGKNMGRAGNVGDAVGGKHARHRERRREIGRAVIETGKHMAMQVDHCPAHFRVQHVSRNEFMCDVQGIEYRERSLHACVVSGTL